MDLVQLVKVLRETGFDLEASDLADILWLARYLPVSNERVENKPTALPGTGQAGDTQAKPIPKNGGATGPRPDLPISTAGGVAKPEQTQKQEVNSTGGAFIPSGAGRQAGGLSIRTAGTSALPGKLAYSRALRPLLRKVPSQYHFTLDEEATIQRIADTQVWLPVMSPEQTRWLELDVVIDEWPSVIAWREPIREFITLLTNLGAFRSVQTWSLWTDPEQYTIELHNGWGPSVKKAASRPPRELVSSRGNRLVLLFSDCVSKAWYNGQMGKLLNTWAHSEMLVLLQLLPEKFWPRTGLVNSLPVYFRSNAPGKSNTQMEMIAAPGSRGPIPDKGVLPLPVLTLDPRSLSAWAQAAIGRNNLWVPGVLIPTNDTREILRQERLQSTRAAAAANKPTDPEELALKIVDRFRRSASAEAWKLAGYFSAASPLNLRLMQLVQTIMMPEARLEHIAEFYLGGLVKRQENETGPNQDPWFDFLPSVRLTLLSSIPRSEAARVIARTSVFISRTTGDVIEMDALVADPARVHELDPDASPFAEIKLDLLRHLGGEYARLAEALEGKKVLRETVVEAADTASQPDLPGTVSASATEQTGLAGLPFSERSTKDGVLLRAAVQDAYVTAMTITPDGRYAICAVKDNNIRCWDISSQKLIWETGAQPATITALLTAPTPKIVFSGSSDGTIRFLDPETGQLLRSLTGHTQAITALAISPEGPRLVSASADGTVRVWLVETGEQLLTYTGHTGVVNALAPGLAPDGRRMFSGAADNTIQYWDVVEGVKLHSFKAHERAVTTLALFPDGKTLVSGSADHTVRVWEIESGNLLETITDDIGNIGHNAPITALALTTDEFNLEPSFSELFIIPRSRIIAGASDGKIRSWYPIGDAKAIHVSEPGGAINTISVAARSASFYVAAGEKLFYSKEYSKFEWSVSAFGESVNIRSGPGETDQIVDRVTPTDRLILLDSPSDVLQQIRQSDAWFHICTPKGVEGFTCSRYNSYADYIHNLQRRPIGGGNLVVYTLYSKMNFYNSRPAQTIIQTDPDTGLNMTLAVDPLDGKTLLVIFSLPEEIPDSFCRVRVFIPEKDYAPPKMLVTVDTGQGTPKKITLELHDFGSWLDLGDEWNFVGKKREIECRVSESNSGKVAFGPVQWLISSEPQAESASALHLQFDSPVGSPEVRRDLFGPTRILYTVKPDDTLESLAAEAQISVAEIKSANLGLSGPNPLSVGQVILIPIAEHAAALVRPWVQDWNLAIAYLEAYTLNNRDLSQGVILFPGEKIGNSITRIHAAADGTVTFVSGMANRMFMLVIEHPQAVVRLPDDNLSLLPVCSRYYNLTNVTVKAGETVTRGQQIADFQIRGENSVRDTPGFDISHTGILKTRPWHMLEKMTNDAQRPNSVSSDGRRAEILANYLNPYQFLLDNHLPEDPAKAAQPAGPVEKPEENSKIQPPLVQFKVAYQAGKNSYFEPFNIETPSGAFLGECGFNISEIADRDWASKGAAFDVWLTDTKDTIGPKKVLASPYVFRELRLRNFLEDRAELIEITLQKQCTLETQTLQMIVTVTGLQYRQGEQFPESIFDLLELELAVWQKETVEQAGVPTNDKGLDEPQQDIPPAPARKEQQQTVQPHTKGQKSQLTIKVAVVSLRPEGIPDFWATAEQLTDQFIQGVQQFSKKQVIFKLAETTSAQAFPPMQGDQRYTDRTWNQAREDDKSAMRDPKGSYLMVDYERLMEDYNILDKVRSGAVDEVWLFGGPYFGLYQSRMIGRNAFWCNAPPLEMDTRRFVLMGFNYERSVREMYEDLGHRAESILAKQYGSQSFLQALDAPVRTKTAPPKPKNDFEKFLVEVGTVHRKPGGEVYSQDVSAWLSALQPTWWPLIADPNRVHDPA